MKKIVLGSLILVVIVVVGGFAAVRLLLNPERVRAAVEAQASAALGAPVNIASVEVDVWPRAGLSLGDVKVGQPAQLTFARAQISTSLFALLSRRIEDAELTIEDSRVNLMMLLGMIGGLSGSQPSKTPQSSSTPALTIVSVRAIGLRNVELVVGDRHANVTLESSLRGDRLEIQRLSAKTADTSLEASGAVVSLLQRVARLKIDADTLDLDGLMQFAGAFTRAPAAAAPAAPGSKPAYIDVEADVNAKRGRVAGLAFTGLHTVIAVSPTALTLRPVSFNALQGRFEGAATVALDQREPSLAVDGNVSGVNLQELAAFASGEPSSITGTLGATIKLNGRGLDADSAIKTATGTSDVQLADGRIPGLQLVRPAILAFGRPQGAPPEGSGEAFERITATVAVGGGRLRTDNLRFVSRDVDVDGAGSLTVAGGGLDVKADVKLSEELSSQAGRDLVRYAHEGNQVVLPAVISGTVESPFVFIDVEQALGRAVKNELQNRANEALKRLIPGGLTKKPPKL
jgi:uncharacterized protein involved in outer membrane biogenesis